MRCFLFALLVLPQDDDLASKLKQGRWAAVEELGAKPELKPKLAELAAGKDADLAWWAGAALAEIEARERAGDAHVAPLRVTVEAKEKPAVEVLRELLATAGVKLRDDPRFGDRGLGQAAITLSLKDAPLLQALDEVSRLGGFSIGRQGDACTLVRAPPRMGAASCTGLLAAAPAQLTLQRDVSFDDEPRTSLMLQAFLRLDPRIRLVQGEGGISLVAALDDTGKSLLSSSRRQAGAMSFSSLGRRWGGANTTFFLEPPAKEAKKIAVVRGTVDSWVALRGSEVVFEKSLTAEPQAKEVDGVKIILKKGSVTEKGVEIQMEVSSAKPFGSWSLPESEEIVLEDETGGVFPRAGMSRSGGSYTLRYAPRGGAAATPGKLRVSLVTQACKRKFHFEMKDLDLP